MKFSYLQIENEFIGQDWCKMNAGFGDLLDFQFGYKFSWIQKLFLNFRPSFSTLLAFWPYDEFMMNIYDEVFIINFHPSAFA